MRYAGTLLLLCWSLTASQAAAWHQDGRERDRQASLEACEQSFEALHAWVETTMLECKTAVSIWQVAMVLGSDGPARLDAGPDNVATCIAQGREEMYRRLGDVQQSAPATLRANAMPALQAYADLAEGIFIDFAPRSQNGRLEDAGEYARRFTGMEQALRASADVVRKRIRMMRH